jgi:hypothetical protein
MSTRVFDSNCSEIPSSHVDIELRRAATYFFQAAERGEETRQRAGLALKVRHVLPKEVNEDF